MVETVTVLMDGRPWVVPATEDQWARFSRLAESAAHRGDEAAACAWQAKADAVLEVLTR